MRGNCRYAVTLKEARSLHLGESMQEFNDYIESLEVDRPFERTPVLS